VYTVFVVLPQVDDCIVVEVIVFESARILRYRKACL
jgi:hypothetical protein